uniref:Uncharacterized protein n=1 Tax=Arundo donax TaxID=35708 RepID=A0A0A9BJC1_ARUDO
MKNSSVGQLSFLPGLMPRMFLIRLG